MRFLHIADLHLGKRVNEFSMLPDQQAILEQMLQTVDNLKTNGTPIDGVLIAGDVYDKALPPAEAVRLFDFFLTELSVRKLSVFLIGGNHDSAERLSFGGRLMQAAGVHVAPVFDGTIQPILCKDDYGEVAVYLLAFVRPSQVAALYDEEIHSYEAAVKAVLDRMDVDSSRRNVLVAHQFVGAHGQLPQTCDSEVSSVGGLELIDAGVFEAFDYVALGHLHGPQTAGRQTVRYAGSPLKYSFSEAHQKKSMTMVELKEKGTVCVTQLPLIPIRDLRIITGPLHELLSPEVAALANTEDYLQVRLTDTDEVFDAIGKVRHVYPNVMRLEYVRESDKEAELHTVEELENRSVLELFTDFYNEQNEKEASKLQMEYVKNYLQRQGESEEEL